MRWRWTIPPPWKCDRSPRRCSTTTWRSSTRRPFPTIRDGASAIATFRTTTRIRSTGNKRTGPENRAAISACVHAGTAQGYLAYADGQVVGWCNAAPRPLYPMLRDRPLPDSETIGSIFCFIVAPSHRGRGIAKALLAAACEGLRAAGMRIVEAHPLKEVKERGGKPLRPACHVSGGGLLVFEEDDEGQRLRAEDAHLTRGCK